jgi:hypothetical protein
MDEIVPGMAVLGMNGNHIGTVDRVEPGHLKLARHDSPDAFHSFIPAMEVAAIRGGKVWIGRRHLPNEALKALGLMTRNEGGRAAPTRSDLEHTPSR